MPPSFPTSQIDPDDAQSLARRHVCAGCWGELTVRYDWRTRTSSISCETPGCTFPGLVTRRFVERQESQSLGELAEAHAALSRAGVLRRRSEQELLKGLIS